jgi:hypothetical protein
MAAIHRATGGAIKVKMNERARRRLLDQQEPGDKTRLAYKRRTASQRMLCVGTDSEG